MSAFFVRGVPANLDASYKLTWSPLQFGPDEYFVLDSDLPIVEDDKEFLWRLTLTSLIGGFACRRGRPTRHSP